MYPVTLSLRGRPILVVGGGGVALRKIEGLLQEGAVVTVIAPASLEAVGQLARRGAIELHQRCYRAGDIAGFVLVFVATNDRDVSRRVFADCREAGVWVNVADDPELCSFQLPARVQRGPLQLAIGSAGGAPFVVRRLRQLLERRFGPEWGEWVEAASRFRQKLRALGLPRSAMERRYDEFFAASVDVERLRARVPQAAEIEAWLAPRPGEVLRPGRNAHEGIAPHASRPSSVPSIGPAGGQGPALVSLVGAGPGDPGLLTLRAKQRLLAADAVVYDRLAAAALPCELRAEVELHCVGKESGHHPVPQDEINALLVRLALAGKRTVRLKGGDPFVFGRGSEEAETLRGAGIPFEVIPGVTAGIGATACAGIPVTHRGESTRVTLVTAHECSKANGPQVRWDLLAQDPHATLVGYMGVSSLPEVARRLMAAGLSPDTPAALISQGTRAEQRSVVSTIADLHAAGLAAGVRPPAIFVVGPTVRRAPVLEWFANRLLFGERVALFTPALEAGAALDAAGAEIVELPQPITPAARVVLQAAPPTGWLLRSAEEVDALEEERGGPGWNPEMRAYCVGGDAAARARELGWPHVTELGEAAALDELVAAIRRSSTTTPPACAGSAG